MKLSDLGFDQWFETHGAAPRQRGLDLARVTTVDRGGYLVRSEEGEIPARLSGRFRFGVRSPSDLPCLGDWAAVRIHDGGAAVIHAVLPRRTFLRRKCAGDEVDFQMIAANVDTAFVVQSCQFDFNLPRLDRYLAMARDGGIEPVILLTKTDLVSPGEVDDMLAAIRRNGAEGRMLAVSGVTGAGMNDFLGMLVAGRTYCFIGSSGVGKTTLINRLLGGDLLRTKAVSGTGEGTHATTRRQLVVLDGGAMLIDTPGMRELGLLGAGGGLERSFEDIGRLAEHCRYATCRHESEPGCAVRAAIGRGSLSEERLRSYAKLRKESEYHEMSYLERRRKDRAFGRLVKSAKKHPRS